MKVVLHIMALIFFIIAIIPMLIVIEIADILFSIIKNCTKK
jgi:hypothetical protein